MALTTLSFADPAFAAPTTQNANQVQTTRLEVGSSVDWTRIRAAIAVSTTRKTTGTAASTKPFTKFISSGVMISPTIGLTAAHSLDQIVEASVIEDVLVTPASARVKIKSHHLHPAYKGNNFTGIDLAIFQLEAPLNLPHYFTPMALSIATLQNEILQRVGHGERPSSKPGDSFNKKENRRTWVLENYNRRVTGTSYLTSIDQYGYPGDSGGPVYRTRTNTNHDYILELLGLHVGRMVDHFGNLINESNTMVFSPDLIEWIDKTAKEMSKH